MTKFLEMLMNSFGNHTSNLEDSPSESDDSNEELTEEILDALEISGVKIWNATTFEERGILTRDEGLVVTMEDGSEYQITVVKSK